MATSPQPAGGNAAEGWTLKQMANDIPLTASAREAIELGQRLATTSGAARTEPFHVLAAIVLSPRNPAHKAMVALKVDLAALRNASDWRELDPARPAAAAPISPATRYLLINAHREAEQIGHYRVDGLHLLLALLYKDSTATAQRLEEAGLSIYAIRQYLTTPGSTPKDVRQRPLPKLDGAVRVSPVFGIPVGAMLLGGAARACGQGRYQA